MGFPAARMGDLHVCPMITVLVPHVGGPVFLPCFPQVLIGGMPAARITDTCICVGPPDVIVKGSSGVFIGGLPAARVLDITAHGGVIVLGHFTTLIGETAAASAQVSLTSALMSLGLDLIRPLLELGNGQIPTTFGPVITIDSTDPVFRAKTLIALAQIAGTPSGKLLLDQLAANGKKVTIRKGKKGNRTTGYDGSQVNPDGTPGAGSDSVVRYNPDLYTWGPEPWETRPPPIGLAHELGHADRIGRGMVDQALADNDHRPDPSDPTKTAQESIEELRAAGIPPFDDEDFNENKIRDEWTDPPLLQRPWY